MNNDSPQIELGFLSPDPGGRGGDSTDGLQIRVSQRARRLSLRVYPDARVEVVVPPRARPREVEQFVAAHRPWIVETDPDKADFVIATQRWRCADDKPLILIDEVKRFDRTFAWVYARPIRDD